MSSSTFRPLTESSPVATGGIFDDFPSYDVKYRCCCRCCDARLGAILVSLMLAGFLSANFYYVQFVQNSGPNLECTSWLSTTVYITSIVAFGWGILGAIGVQTGLCRAENVCLLPQMALQVTLIACTAGISIACIVYLVQISEFSTLLTYVKCEWIYFKKLLPPSTLETFTAKDWENSITIILSLTIALCLVTCVFQFWFLSITRAAYLFIGDKQAWTEQMTLRRRLATQFHYLNSPLDSFDSLADLRHFPADPHHAPIPKPVAGHI